MWHNSLRKEYIPMIDINRLFLIKLPKDILVLNKEKLSYNLFFIGIVIAFYGSINPWFMWPLGKYYAILSCVFVLSSMFISATLKKPIFNKNNYLLSIVSYIVLVYYQSFVNEESLTSYIYHLFNICIFFSIFRINQRGIQRLSTLLAKSMGYLLSISMPFFALYILGFPLPYNSISFGELYSYSNYFFFLVDDRSIFQFIPRFQSVFLEPGQLGTVTALLLLMQHGQWKRWYNIMLIIATLISFSLSAYVLFTIAIFLSLWMQGREIIKKICLSVGIIATIVIGSFYYNDGFNLVHDLIILRLEIEDGEMVGDNRVQEGMQAEYETFLLSSDIFLGKNFEREWGGAGYKIYLLDYGLVGLFFVAVFYIISLYSPNKRAYLSALILGALNFAVRDFPLWYAYYLPLLCNSNLCFPEPENDCNNENGLES